MPVPFDVKHLFGNKQKDGDSTSNPSSKTTTHPFNFEDGSYQYPSMAEEALEMLQVSMLIYSITDLRSLAKHPKKSTTIKAPQRILDLPLSLTTCLELLEENYDVVKETFGDDEHANTISSLQSIHARYQQLHQNNNTSPKNNATVSFVAQWLNPLLSSGDSQGIEVQPSSSSTTTIPQVPLLTAYGDENPETDMVYAVGIDPIRKRVTVAFRGSVTPTDFIKDASIIMNHQPNPIKQLYPHHEYDTVGIHQGFFDYLLKKRIQNRNKLEEIVEHVIALFREVPERQSTYKLYVTGHSLGGALATLFSLYVASSIGDKSSNIPGPVSCISVASPRVGDRNFQAAFAHLEEHGLLRHLRIANHRDPVTIMPGATGKKIWATLSPVSFIAFKLMDNQFTEKETFRHTGIKLLLGKGEYEFFYAGNPLDDVEADDQKASQDKASPESNASTKEKSRQKTKSIRKEKIPDVVFHLGKAYTDNITSVAQQLSNISLNDLYRIQVAAIVAKGGMVEEGEQS
ncbi:lipase class 3 [Nitzschia inconspicua]|uniref:Lipase class 3 n=1 Tax=Nitzschia inconspicua TaxID=303405 RepID=A0A9K3PZ66_9STRA|nr:lipase class 3 [Nitzschia inconspicua]